MLSRLSGTLTERLRTQYSARGIAVSVEKDILWQHFPEREVQQLRSGTAWEINRGCCSPCHPRDCAMTFSGTSKTRGAGELIATHHCWLTFTAEGQSMDVQKETVLALQMPACWLPPIY